MSVVIRNNKYNNTNTNYKNKRNGKKKIKKGNQKRYRKEKVGIRLTEDAKRCHKKKNVR